MILSNFNNTQKICFKGKATGVSQSIIDALLQYKGNPYDLNLKLRGADKARLTRIEKQIKDGILQAPREILKEDTFVYRGIGDTWSFEPLTDLKVGEIYQDKGFASVSPFERVAKQFRYSVGVIAKIFLPKGSEVINIDSVLLNNYDKLPNYKKEFYDSVQNPNFELLLLPNSKFHVKSYSNKGSIFDPDKHINGYDQQSHGTFEFDYLPQKTFSKAKPRN